MKRLLNCIVCVALLITLCLGVFFGCSRKTSEDTSNQPSTPPEVSTPSETEEPTPSKPKEPPEIEYTIDETLPTGSKNANHNSFYSSRVRKVKDSPLAGKTIYWLGSSVTYGANSGGEAMAEFLAAKTGAICKKDAVSGTTILDDGSDGLTGAKSYTRHLTTSTVFDKTEHVDAFVCQISTNDAVSTRLGKRGTVTDATVQDKDDFDLGTTMGGVEYIIAYVSETWGCPVYLYSGSYFGDNGSGEFRVNGDPSGTNYGKFVDDVKVAVQKWQELGYDVDVIDMFNDKAFNATVSEGYYSWCMADAIHPMRAGYLNWWMPYFERYLIVKLDPEYSALVK